MGLRKIEIIEEGGIKEGVNHRQKGDVCSIDENLAKAYIDAGLAKCVETGESGVRIEGVSKVSLDKVTIPMSSNK